MANPEHLDILKQGSDAWNAWRVRHKKVRPDLSGADLRYTGLRYANLNGANLSDAQLSHANLNGADLRHASLNGADLGWANLNGADLSWASLQSANLNEADLSHAHLSHAILNGAYLGWADLSHADLSYAQLVRADLSHAHLNEADLSHAGLYNATLSNTDLSNTNLSRADLSRAILVRTKLVNTTLKDCHIYGISAWDVQLDGAKQLNLTITPSGKPAITVDNLKIAQFIYLLLNNAEIRGVIDTIAKKAVLILGRFTPERKVILDALREALRTHGYVPILFDFDKPSSQDLTETVSTLAHLSRFIIVDLTDPSSAPYEVGMIASNHIRPIQAIFHPSDEAKKVFAMFLDLIRRYHWVLVPYEYQDQDHLLTTLKERVIDPAEQKAQELEKR